MTIYKQSIIITAILSLTSFIMAIIANHIFSENFWCNVCLGVFGSSLLAFITSVIGYFSEKRNCMEGFYFEALKFANYINRYQSDMMLNDKIDFFLSMEDYDMTELDAFLGKMNFFRNKQRQYIFNKIYSPIKEVYCAISKHFWHFRMHKNKTGENETVMNSFIGELEQLILDKRRHLKPLQDDYDCIVSSVSNKFIDMMLHELNGHYYEIMYGKKYANQIMHKNFDSDEK